MSLHIVLYQPELAANTGNIARTCAATETSLHVIMPIGFSQDDKNLKRAGLDYWEFVSLTYYDSVEEFFENNNGGEYYYLTENASTSYTTVDFSRVDSDFYFFFGKESTGLPQALLENNHERCLRIPMNLEIPSLNLSNSVAILLYEALRQRKYVNLK